MILARLNTANYVEVGIQVKNLHFLHTPNPIDNDHFGHFYLCPGVYFMMMFSSINNRRVLGHGDWS